jgi:hypothetical protein
MLFSTNTINTIYTIYNKNINDINIKKDINVHIHKFKLEKIISGFIFILIQKLDYNKTDHNNLIIKEFINTINKKIFQSDDHIKTQIDIMQCLFIYVLFYYQLIT